MMIRNPVMFVVEIVAALTTVIFLRDLADRRRTSRLHLPDHPLALVHRAVRQLRRSGRRRPRQGPGRDPAPDAHRDDGATACTATGTEDGRRRRPEAGRHRPGRGRRTHPERRRGDRRHRLGRRIRHHRRVRPGHPRERRRPLGRHRRHPRAVRLDQGAHHRRPGLHLPRPHDRAGRRRRAAEDAERDRAEHPARRPDDHLRLRRRRRSPASPPTPAASISVVDPGGAVRRA